MKKKTVKKVITDKQKIRDLGKALEAERTDKKYYLENYLKSKREAEDLRDSLNVERRRVEELLLELGKKKMESAVAYGRLSVLMRMSNLYNRPEIETVDNLPFEREY